MRTVRYLVLVTVIVAAGVGGYFLGARPRGCNTPATEGPKEQPAPRDVALEGVPRNGVFVATVKVPKIWDHAALKPHRDWLEGRPERRQLVEPYLGFSPGELDRISIFWHSDTSIQTPWDERAIEPYVLISTKMPYDQTVVEKRLQARPQGWPWLGRMTAIDPTCLFLGSPMEGYFRAIPPSVSRLMTISPDGVIAPALDEAKTHAITVGVDVDRFARELGKRYTFDRAPYAELLAARSAILTADLEDALAVRLVLSFADEPAATRAMPVLEKQLAALAGAIDRERKLAASDGEEGAAEAAVLSWLAGALRQAKVTVARNSLTAEARIPFDEAFQSAVAAVPGFLEGELRLKPAISNLKAIGIGMYAFESANGAYPAEKPAMRPPWSWRVQILPYIEHENLYKLLDMNKPWNDPANLKVLKEHGMPSVFKHPGRPAPEGHTFFRIFTRPKDAKGGTSPIFQEGFGGRPTSITDGTSNTIMVVEAQDAVPWYELDVLPYDGVMKLPPLGGKTARRFLALMADGNVLRFLKSTPEKTLRAHITASGGEEIDRPR